MYESLIVNVAYMKALKLAVFFALVGAMMVILIPMLNEKADAATDAKVRPGDVNLKMSNLKYQLDQGKWVSHPRLWSINDNYIIWATKGSGFFGGTERGSVEVDVKLRVPEAHVKFTWYNPSSGANTCGIEITGSHPSWFRGACEIDQGSIAHARYVIASSVGGGPILRQ